MKLSKDELIKQLELTHLEPFKNIAINYYLSPSGILYSYFKNKLRLIKPSYITSRGGIKRPTLRISMDGERKSFLQYRLTAQYFKYEDEDISDKQINHMDGETFNVHPDNLETSDQENNCAHRDFKNKLYEVIDRKEEIL